MQEKGWEKHLISHFCDVQGVTSILPLGVNFCEATELLRLRKADSAFGGSCLSMWKEVVCVQIMSSGLGTGKIHTWYTLPRALLGELPKCSPCTVSALPKQSWWWAERMGGVLLRVSEKWLWAWPRAATCLGERRGRIDPKGCVSLTTATSSDPCLLISRLGWFEPVRITPVLHVMSMTPPEAQHHSTPFSSPGVSTGTEKLEENLYMIAL